MHFLRPANRGGEDRGQRSRGASNNTLIPRDSFTTACAQACPTEAIVFGDITDPESRVSKMKKQDRNYRLLAISECEYAHELSGADSGTRIRRCLMPEGSLGVASLGHEGHGEARANHDHTSRQRRETGGETVKHVWTSSEVIQGISDLTWIARAQFQM